MPRKIIKVKEEEPDRIPLTCGACRFYVKEFRGSGVDACVGMPPQILFGDDDEVTSARPIVRKDDPACSLHQPTFNS